MSQTATNRAKFRMADAYVSGGSTAPDMRLGLLKTLASHANVPDLNTVADMEAHADFAELTGSGYARVAVTGEAVTEVDASDWALIDFDDVAFAAIATGETILGCFLFNHTGGADNARDLLAVYDLTSTPTNGSTVTVTTASGAVKVT